MKRIAVLVCLFAASFAVAQERATLAVDKVKVSPALSGESSGVLGRAVKWFSGGDKDERTALFARVAESLDRYLLTSLNASRKFTIVGRRDLQNILNEQDLGQSGILNDESAAQLGEVKGAKYKLVTFVDSFQEVTETATFVEGSKVKRRLQVSAQAMIYDNSTGEVIDTANIQTELVDIMDVEPGSVNRPAGRMDEMIPQVTRQLADKLTARLLAVLFPVRILDVDGDTITLNRGEGFFQVGQMVAIMSGDKTVKDPDTGEMIRIKGRQQAQARIVSVDPNTAQAKMPPEMTASTGARVELLPNP